VFLIPALALVVAAPSGPDQGCPSPRQITEALNARMPDVVSPAAEGARRGGLRLLVSGGAAPEPLRIEIFDQGGETRLQRNLTPSERERGNDCPALAETVALIVDRYLHEVGYEVPLAPAPAPPASPEREADLVVRAPAAPLGPARDRFDLLAAALWRGASTGNQLEGDFGVGIERALGAHRLGATLTGGLAPSQSARLTNGTATLRRYPLHLGGFLAVPLGPGWLEPGAGLGLDWLVTSVQWTRDSASFVRVSPAADLEIGYRVTLGGRFFLRGSASLDLAVPYQFVPPATATAAASGPPAQPAAAAVFTTPRIYVKSGLELGFSFQ
jgi:hypothetical protein